MNFKELSKSRACREFIKELLSDKNGHLANELKDYVQRRAVEEQIVINKNDITPGIFSRACQDTLERENGLYTRDENGFYKMVLGEISMPLKAVNKEINMNDGVVKILKDTIKKLNKEINRKPLLELTKDDFECIQEIKPLIESLENSIKTLS